MSLILGAEAGTKGTSNDAESLLFGIDWMPSAIVTDLLRNLIIGV
jgi:hypothetical protein